MKITIFHNPRCTKSRQTLKLLEEKGVEPEVVLYLESPPTEKELAGLLKKLGIPAKELIRFKEPLAKELRISARDEKAEAAWIKLMSRNPKLIERPIVVRSDKAVLGRPPEKVLSLL